MDGRNPYRVVVVLAIALLIPISVFAQCATTTLSCGSTIGASLTTSDCLSADSSDYDLYQFSGTSGQTISVEMHSTAFDTYLGLIDPSGVPVADSDDFSTSSTDSTIAYTLT